MIHITRRLQDLLLVLLLLGGSTSWSAPVSTAFTYQGRLTEENGPANGRYDFRFRLFDEGTSITSIGAGVTHLNVAVSNGLFTVPLDFGTAVFNGTALWLEIGVRTNGADGFTDLSPRQPLTPTPYAIAAAKLTDPLSDTLLSSNVVLRSGDQTFSGSNTFAGVNDFSHPSNRFVGSFVGDGSGLSNLSVNASALLGQLSDRQLPSTIPRLTADALFTGAVIFSNPSNRFAGDGGELIGINPTNVSPGTAAISITGNAGTATSAAVAATAAVSYRFTEPLAGDVTGAHGGTLVNGIRGVQVSPAAPLTNQHLRYDGSNWAPGSVVLETDIIGSLPDWHLSTNVGLLNANQVYTGNNLYSGVADFSNVSNTFLGRFTGDGSGLSNLNIGHFVGVLPETQLPPNVMRLDANQVIAGILTFSPASGAPFAVGSSNPVANLNADLLDGMDSSHFAPAGHLHSADELVSGRVPDERLAGVYSSVLGFPNASNSFSGAFLGDGSGLSNLNAGVLTGIVPDHNLSPSIARVDADQVVTGSNVFSGVTIMTNETNDIVGTFRGNGAGLSNIVVTAANVQGPLESAQLTGPLPSSLLAGIYDSALAFNNPANVFTGDGMGLTGVNAERLSGFGAASFWQLGGNMGTTEGVNFLGTTDNQPLEFKVNGQRALRLEPTTNSPNVIGGFHGNHVSSNAVGVTIGGGGTEGMANVVDRFEGYGKGFEPHFASIGGGANNAIYSSRFGTIGGGVGNSVSPLYISSTVNTICGGAGNSLEDTQFSTIGGGQGNQMRGDADGVYYSTIGGGQNNSIDALPVPSFFDTIAGGGNNSIRRSNGATIGGGRNNSLTQYSDDATISGGTLNSIWSESRSSTIGGGSMNEVNGRYGTVPGGYNNVAAEKSFAAGSRAKANHPGAFVWADSSAFDFAATNANSFSVRSVGGARFVSAIDVEGASAAGVELVAGGGSWSSLSDRNAKTNFTSINPREVLERVSRLPIGTWNYKSQDPGVRHIGPMAQDFAAAFQVGESDRRITTVDADGVSLAAIQGLNSLVREQEEQIAGLRQENEGLVGRLDKLEKIVQALTVSGVSHR